MLGLPDGGAVAAGDGVALTLTDSSIKPTRLYDVSGTLVQGAFTPVIHTAALAPDGTAWAAGDQVGTDFRVVRLATDGWHEVAVDAGTGNIAWFAMTFAQNGEGWAAGDEARIWHFTPGSGWSFAWKDPSGSDAYLAVAEAGGEVWVAGVGGRAARWSQGTWTSHPFPDPLDDIAFLYASGGVFHAVGRMSRYTLDTDGVTWRIEPGLPVDLSRRLGHGRVVGDRGFIAGEAGALLSFPR